MSVVGIDFGCQNATIAAAGRGGVDVILNGNSNRLNPCMVKFDKSRSMGEAAASTALSKYRDTVKNMKRLIGMTWDDPRAQREMALLPYECVPFKHASGHPDTIGVSVTVGEEEQPVVISVEHVAGMMVKHLGQIAAVRAANSSADSAATPESCFPQDWVIAIPGYYTDAQRRAFLVGCEVAGIPKIQRLMHETTSTALAYGIFKDIRKEFANKTEPTNVMFIDMGYTSYQVAIVSFEPGKLIVRTTHADADLGGRDFSAAIAGWIADQFQAKYKNKLSADPRSNKKTWLKLLAAGEKAKKTLSPAGVTEARINVECLMDDLDFGGTLKTAEYEKMVNGLLDRLEPPIKRALDEAKMKPADLTSVELVGGATRVACVKRTLAKILKLDAKATNMGLSTTMNADEAVCRGAALQSAILSPRFKVLPYEIVEFQPYPVQVDWSEDAADKSMEVTAADVEGGDGIPSTSVVMFERGSTFPLTRRVTLRRSGEFGVKARYDEGATFYPQHVSKDIALFKIKAPEGAEQKIKVNVKQDNHGIIALSSAQMVEEVEEEEMEEAKPEGEKPADGGGDKAGADAEMKDASSGEKKPDEEGEQKKEEGAAAAEEEPKKKKKVKRTNLPFETSRPVEWSRGEIDAGYELEVKMTNSDRIVKETADKRNELESYLYEMRDKIIGDLSSFATDDERAKFSSALEKTENWLYEDGFDAVKSVYTEHLSGVRSLGDPIVKRQEEGKARPQAVSSLQRTVERYKSWLNSCTSDEKFAHITEEEQSKCHAKCDEISSWMYDMLDKQGLLPSHADPAVTAAQIHGKTKELVDTVSPVMNKPVPRPPKVEEKPQQPPAPAKEAGDAKKANGDAAPEPMDTEGGGDGNKAGEPMEVEKGEIA